MIALFILFHACSFAPADRADLWMDELIVAKRAIFAANAADWRLDYSAAGDMFARCNLDEIAAELAGVQTDLDGLRAAAADINAINARRGTRRRRIW